jgi:hypothetical protein
MEGHMSKREPKLEYHGAQPYVGMRRSVTMRDLGTVLPPLHRELGEWMQAHGVSPAGAPFWRYLVVHMEGKLVVDVGFPATADLLEWAGEKGIAWKMNGREWAGRVEWYLSDPARQPDMSTWTTEIAFLTAVPNAAKEG